MGAVRCCAIDGIRGSCRNYFDGLYGRDICFLRAADCRVVGFHIRYLPGVHQAFCKGPEPGLDFAHGEQDMDRDPEQ